MRAFALFAVLASPAAADPKKPDVTLPDVVKEALDKIKVKPTQGVVGMDGVMASGIVIEPPPHPDARPYGKGGMVIAPPETNDPMALIPGTNQLRPRERVDAWFPRDWSRELKRGADKVWDFVLPKL